MRYMCMYVCMYVCVRACVRVCACVCVCKFRYVYIQYACSIIRMCDGG